MEVPTLEYGENPTVLVKEAVSFVSFHHPKHEKEQTSYLNDFGVYVVKEEENDCEEDEKDF
eukprot:10162564-Ditylum_brightwellii.AAC.1